MADGLSLTDNQRLQVRTRYSIDEIQPTADMRDGSLVPLALHQAANGAVGERARFKRIQDRFRRMTRRQLGLRVEYEADSVILAPQVVDGAAELPIRFAGAGAAEALVLATLVEEPTSRVLVLDEPAVNLAPIMQRRLLSEKTASGRQCVVITHSADLVPTELGGIQGVVRLSMQGSASKLATYSSNDHRWHRHLRRSEVRSLLFASGVLLCEGDTEVGALSYWLEGLGADSPDARGVTIIDVGGQNNFPIFVRSAMLG